MKKSYSKDVQLLMKILQNQVKIKQAITTFNCDERTLDSNDLAFDLCSFYMSQIGEAAKLLTDTTKNSFKYFNPSSTTYFRNMIDHVYEKVNRQYIKAYIFNMISKEVMTEIKDRITFCTNNAKTNNTPGK